MPFNPCCCGESPCICCPSGSPTQWELVVNFGNQDLFGVGYSHCTDISGTFYLDPIDTVAGGAAALCAGDNCCWWSPEFVATTRTDASPPFDTATYRWLINTAKLPVTPLFCSAQLALVRYVPASGNWVANDGIVAISTPTFPCGPDAITFGVTGTQFTSFCWMGHGTHGGALPVATPIF